MTIGEKIRYLRLNNNMTMDDLARELGVQRSAINKYEKGIVVNLKRSTISSLCRVFGVSSAYFLDDSSDLTPDEEHLLTLWRGANDQARSDVIDLLEKHQRVKKDSTHTA